MRIVLIRGGKCINVIECSQEEAEALVQNGSVDSWNTREDIGVGDEFDGATVTPAPPVIAMRTLTKRQFLRRFTATEREAIENLRATATQVRKDKINAFVEYISDGVESNDSYIVSSVNALETFGVLAAGRAAVILAF